VESNDIELAPTSSWAMRPMYEHLIGLDPATNKFIPQLATEWKLEPDNKSYRFSLRKGVKFHFDKGEVTTKDIEFMLKGAVRQGEVRPTNSSYFGELVEKIEVVNDYEFVMRNRQPDADLINQLSELVGVAWQLYSKQDFDDQGGYPTLASKRPLAATGPYQFVERATASYVRFERVPYQHWRIRPDFPEFEWRFMSEASSRTAALLTGEVQVTSLPRDLKQQVLSQGMQLIRGKVPSQRTFLSMQCCYLKDPAKPEQGLLYPESPLLDVRVRQALNKAIKRDEMNKSFYNGQAEPMYLNHFHPTRQAWNPDWEKRFPQAYGYDPDAAKKLLADAGYGPGHPLKTNMNMVKLPDVAESEDLQEAIAGYWRSIGVDVTLVTLDNTARNNRQRARGFDNHFTVVGTSSHQLYGIFVYNVSFFATGSTGTYTKEIDAMWPPLGRELDPKRQDELYRQIGDKLYDSFLGVPLFWLPAEAIANSKYVSDWIFPGSISGTWTHVETIKAVSK